MDTELERLKAWMERNGHDDQSFAQVMSKPFGRLGATLNVLNGKKPITQAFRFRFLLHFGRLSLLEVFGIDSTNFGEGLADRDWYPEKYAAHKAVAKAIGRGELLPAKEYKCHACSKQARQHHHQSYHPNDHLCVVPLCQSCHAKANHGTLDVTFGVVATRAGVIRIAIAGLTTT